MSVQQTFDSIFDAVVPVRGRGHLDNFSSNELVLDPIAVLVERLGQGEVLFGGQDCRGRHASILASYWAGLVKSDRRMKRPSQRIARSVMIHSGESVPE